MSRLFSDLLLGLLCICLTACGTVTPSYQEFWGEPRANDKKVAAIASQVRCELSRTIQDLMTTDSILKPSRLDFLHKWGVQSLLQLTIDEKTAVNPGVSINSPLPNAFTAFANGSVTTSQMFAGAFGGGGSSEANRIDKISFFYTVDELNDPRYANAVCYPGPIEANLFDIRDLGIDDWLRTSFNTQEFRLNDLSRGKMSSVLSHDIKFQIVTSGNVTPMWKLVRFSGNNVNPLLSVSRDRSQELIITMGPQDKQFGGLVQAAQTLSLSSQFAAGVAAQLRPGM